jgi:quercetin dioxygenase-like cupin family protein
MIVRNMNQEEVLRGLYRAHGGGTAAMLFDDADLQGILFLAQGMLKPGRELEDHVDPYEEIYYVLQGQGRMRVGDDRRVVRPGDAALIPCGAIHGLVNDGSEDCIILVVAAFPRHDQVREGR